eukprot:55985-Eustigmatos_ZCMA.PRE.1
MGVGPRARAAAPTVIPATTRRMEVGRGRRGVCQVTRRQEEGWGLWWVLAVVLVVLRAADPRQAPPPPAARPRPHSSPHRHASHLR